MELGDVIHGHVEGWFGRDFYDCARIEYLAADWVVVRQFSGTPWFASGPGLLAALEKARGYEPEYHSIGCPGNLNLEEL